MCTGGSREGRAQEEESSKRKRKEKGRNMNGYICAERALCSYRITGSLKELLCRG